MRPFTLIRVLLDIMIIPLVVIGAYTLKFKVGLFFFNFFNIASAHIYPNAQVEPYLHALWFIVLIWLFTFLLSGVYRKMTGLMPLVDECILVFKGVSIVTIELMAFTFIFRPFPGSRYMLVYCWILGIFCLCLSRLLIYYFEYKSYKHGRNMKSALIIGTDRTGQSVAENMIISPTLGYFYTGSLDYAMPEYCHFHLRDRLSILGPPESFHQFCDTRRISALFVTIALPHALISQLIATCRTQKIELFLDFELYPMSVDPLCSVQEFDGIPFLVPFVTTNWSISIFFKRALDIVMSILLLILLSPLLAIVSCIILITSPNGPIIYAQERIGKDNRPFMMYKFRTMVPDAESKTGPVMVSLTKESRYIPMGDLFRKASIDELPQLWNILCGTMSLVGPRPERPFFVDKFSEEIPHFRLRHMAKAGLTGWAQINGRSVLTQNPEHKLRYDLHYIRHWSLAFDLKILIKTIFVVFSREEAY